MKVVVAGLPNTGTEAIAMALTRLGYNVYGRDENRLQLTKEWVKVLHEHATIDDIKQMFKGVEAVADIPACYFWEEILRAYPDTKIIFTKHRSEDEWVEETAERIKRDNSDCDRNFLNMTSPTMCNINKRVIITAERLVYGFSPPSLCSKLTINKSLLRKRYRAHNAHVLENAPKDQLLVYDVSEEWKPLCEFLGDPVPNDQIFPSVEEGKAAAKQRLENNPVYCRAKREQKIIVSLFVVAISAGVIKLVNSPPSVLERTCDWIQKTVLSAFGKS